MSITGLHIPHDDRPMAPVRVNEKNAISYYPYVQGGPVEGGYLAIEGVDFVVYVNSRYPQLSAETVNPRASSLFEMAGVGMFGDEIRGDALMVLAPGRGDYERSLPPQLIEIFLAGDNG